MVRRLNAESFEADECGVNIPAEVDAEYVQTIGGQTSMVMIFNLKGKLTRTITYSLADHWEWKAGNPPTVVDFP